MLANSGIQPNHYSLAFQVASNEYSACGNWTRASAVESLKENQEYQRIVEIEPRLAEVITEIINVRARRGIAGSGSITSSKRPSRI